MNDIAAIAPTQTGPKSAKLGTKAGLATSLVRLDGVEVEASAETGQLAVTQMPASRKGLTAQVVCYQAAGDRAKKKAEVEVGRGAALSEAFAYKLGSATQLQYGRISEGDLGIKQERLASAISRLLQ